MQPIKAGEPQGSVLGPVLFLLFINYLPLYIGEAYLKMYADDTTVYYADKDKTKLEQHPQNNRFQKLVLLKRHAHSQAKDIADDVRLPSEFIDK